MLMTMITPDENQSNFVVDQKFSQICPHKSVQLQVKIRLTKRLTKFVRRWTDFGFEQTCSFSLTS